MNAAVTLDILRLGQRGEGVAQGLTNSIFVPDGLPGERLAAEVEGDRGRILEILRPSPDRIAPICPYYGTCGGCAIQSLAPAPYAEWKRGLVATALSMAHVDAAVGPTVMAHGAGRRRATFHARAAKAVNVLIETPPAVGFMQARQHDIVAIAFCPILSPDMADALDTSRSIATALASTGKPLDILVTATQSGLDIDLRGCGPLDDATTARLIAVGAAHRCARISNHGEVVIESRAPLLTMGQASVYPPPGSFLQATQLGEDVLAAQVLAGVGAARRVLDLFSGIGTFALRLAERATVHAVDLEAKPLAALARAARHSPSLRPVTIETRDLFRRPLTSVDLAAYDAVVFDPPRAGAAAQAEQIAASAVPTVVAVSCSPASFARDAAILIAGGYQLGPVVPVDQFIYSAHIELVAAFRKPTVSAKKRRSLLS
ncbi:RNA methyltransferase [Lichenihabitans sp. PAMC28606]|uniref:class I SAM-dependent RNA methyltransferase n=1 Tax=Lichenihabitans sp. PAMC28606 TaxID=2880932 RepID=UPI001D0AB68E|nr:RNA methyltransferase [Lichenihabitans sp. PAMC28606]UDL95030.1 RNA methyltransferase [Lichenihabitans sp. PAMC28606]